MEDWIGAGIVMRLWKGLVLVIVLSSCCGLGAGCSFSGGWSISVAASIILFQLVYLDTLVGAVFFFSPGGRAKMGFRFGGEGPVYTHKMTRLVVCDPRQRGKGGS